MRRLTEARLPLGQGLGIVGASFGGRDKMKAWQATHLESEPLSVDRLRLDLVGPFRFRDAEGHDLAPRGRKAQGLLALIATSPQKRRSRAWLQDKLWSDRGPPQGAASLRQSLLEIRAALGPYRSVLIADRGWVGFDTDRVEVRLEPTLNVLGDEGEFLEGLEVRDPEFEHWVRDQRSLFAGRRDRTPDPHTPQNGNMRGRVVALSRRAGATDDDVVSDTVLDLLGQAIVEQTGIELVDLRAAEMGGAHHWRMQAAAARNGTRARVTLSLSEAGTGRLRWTESLGVDVADCYAAEAHDLTGLVGRATAALRARLGVAHGSVSAAERSPLLVRRLLRSAV